MTQCILYIGFLEECSLLVLLLTLGFRKTYQSITNPPRRSCDEIQIFNPIILCCAVLEYAGVRRDLYEPSISLAGQNHTRVNDLYQVRCHHPVQARLLHNLGTCIISPCESSASRPCIHDHSQGRAPVCREYISTDCHAPKLKLARLQFALLEHLFPATVL